jgi:hypothetical protein
MSATSRRRWPASACLLVALILALGLGGGAVQARVAYGAHHPVVATAGASGPQAVLGPQSPAWLGGHLGKAVGPVSALVIGLLLARWRRSSAAFGVPRTAARPSCGSRAPPARRPA